MTDPAAVIEFLLTEGRSIILERFKPSSCIASTRIGIDVLRGFGLRSYPIATRVVAYNAAAARLVTARVPVDEWPDEAWSVGIQGSGVSKAGEWDGHLVIGLRDSDGREGVLDLSADQMSRPTRGLEITPILFHPPTWPFGATLANGVVIAYGKIKSRSFKSSPDWSKDRARPSVLAIMDRLNSG